MPERSPVSSKATELILAALREMRLTGAADYVEALATERDKLIEATQSVIDNAHVTVWEERQERGVYVAGRAFGQLESLVASMEEPIVRPRLTVHQGGGPPARPTKRRVSIPEGDPA